MKIWQERDGWAYQAGRGKAIVNGWHRDRDQAERLAKAYEKRIGGAVAMTPEESRKHTARIKKLAVRNRSRAKPKSVSIRPDMAYGAV